MAVKAAASAEQSREQAVEAAWDEVESGGDVDEGTGSGAEAREGAEPAVEEEAPAGRKRNADGTFAEEDEREDEEAGGEEGGEEEAPAAEEEEPVPEGAGEPDAEGAEAAAAAAAASVGAAGAQPGAEGAWQPPQSWKPGERDALSKLTGPQAAVVKAAVTRREAQMQGYVKETEQIRGFANEFVRQAEPYRPLFAMLNTTPLAAFGALMQTASVLYQGDSRMKAKAVADLMKERGVDPNIVADFLDGKTADGAPVVQPDPQVQQLMQKVGTLEQQLSTQAEHEEQARQEQADQFVANWSKDKPWYHDVKKRMGLMMQAARQSGEQLTLDQAYATAISLDPEISKLEKQRLEALAVKAKKKQADAAKRAGSSPRPSPAARGRGTPTGDRLSDVEAAWDEVEGRAG